MAYKEATEVESSRKLSTRQLLKELALKDKDSGHFHCLITSLARIVAAKPHSADDERLISVYNKAKSNDRASLSPGTIKNYLHVSQNMGDLETFDPSQAALDWLETKAEERLPEKAEQQEWFLGVYQEASLFIEQIKLGQANKDKGNVKFEHLH